MCINTKWILLAGLKFICQIQTGLEQMYWNRFSQVYKQPLSQLFWVSLTAAGRKVDLILINFQLCYLKILLDSNEISKDKTHFIQFLFKWGCNFSVDLSVFTVICAKTLRQTLESSLTAKMADIFLGSILTSSNHGAPFPVGFSEENTVFTLGGIGGIWPFYFFIVKTILVHWSSFSFS